MRRTFIIAVTSLAVAIPVTASVATASDPASQKSAPVARDTSAATAARQVAQARPYTTIVLRVHSCRNCPVQLVQARSAPGSSSVWHTRTTRLHDGRASFFVPTARTHGMSFELSPRWSTADWITNVVTRYAHTHVGQRVSAETAAPHHRAYGCWSGTAQRHATLRVRAVKFPNRDLEGHPGYALRAWFAVSRASMSPAVGTYKGSIGNQDAFYCSG